MSCAPTALGARLDAFVTSEIIEGGMWQRACALPLMPVFANMNFFDALLVPPGTTVPSPPAPAAHTPTSRHASVSLTPTNSIYWLGNVSPLATPTLSLSHAAKGRATPNLIDQTAMGTSPGLAAAGAPGTPGERLLVLPRTISALSVQSEVTMTSFAGPESAPAEDAERTALTATRLVGGRYLHDVNATLTAAQLRDLCLRDETPSGPLSNVDGVRPTDRLCEGMTPLMASIALGFDSVAECLVKELRAQVHIVSPRTGESALHVACRFGRVSVLRRLLLPCTPHWLLMERAQPCGAAEEQAMTTAMGTALRYQQYAAINAMLDHLGAGPAAVAKARELLLTALPPAPNELTDAPAVRFASLSSSAASGSAFPSPMSSPHRAQAASGGPSPAAAAAPAPQGANILHVLCRRSHDAACLSLLERLVLQGPVAVDRGMALARDAHGRTPHFYCATSGAVRCLSIALGCPVVSPTSSFSSTSSGTLPAMMRELQAVPTDRFGNTPLHVLVPNAKPRPGRSPRAHSRGSGLDGLAPFGAALPVPLDDSTDFALAEMARGTKEVLVRRLVADASQEDDFVGCLTSLHNNQRGVPVLHALIADDECAMVLGRVIADRYYPPWRVILRLCTAPCGTARGHSLLHHCAANGLYHGLQVLLTGAAVPMSRTPETFVARAEQVAAMLTQHDRDGLPPMFLTAHCPDEAAAYTASVLLLPCLELLRAAKELGPALVRRLCVLLVPVLSAHGAVLDRTHVLHYLCQSNATEAFRGWRKTVRALLKAEAAGIGRGRPAGDYPLQAALTAMFLSRDHTTRHTCIGLCLVSGSALLLGYVLRTIVATVSSHALLQALDASNAEGELCDFFASGGESSSSSRRAPKFAFRTAPPSEAQVDLMHGITPPDDAVVAVEPRSEAFLAYVVPSLESLCGGHGDDAARPSTSSPDRSAQHHWPLAATSPDPLRSNGGTPPGQALDCAPAVGMASPSVAHRKMLMFSLLERFHSVAASAVQSLQRTLRLCRDETADRKVIAAEWHDTFPKWVPPEEKKKRWGAALPASPAVQPATN